MERERGRGKERGGTRGTEVPGVRYKCTYVYLHTPPVQSCTQAACASTQVYLRTKTLGSKCACVHLYLKRGYTNRRTRTRVLTHIHQYSGVLEICVPVHKCTYVPKHSCPSVPLYLNAGYTNGRTPNSCEKRKR